MSIIGQQLAESKLREKYVMRAKKRDLLACIMGDHIPELHHYQGVQGEFLKDSFPRRCTICGELLFPKTWKLVRPKGSSCRHKTIGYYAGKDGTDRLVNRFPQACKHCGMDLEPKTWEPWRE